jgi:hypothetical protein
MEGITAVGAAGGLRDKQFRLALAAEVLESKMRIS